MCGKSAIMAAGVRVMAEPSATLDFKPSSAMRPLAPGRLSTITAEE